jgi:hypothetical protein
MEITTVLIFIQLAMLLAQAWCVFFSVKNKKDPIDVWWGFGMWGSIPSLTIMCIVLAL